MRLSKIETALLNFLIKYPDTWQSYGNDAKTLRAVAGLFFYKGLGIRGFEINRHTHQMKLNSKVFGLKAII